jgi:hypothetical protein
VLVLIEPPPSPPATQREPFHAIALVSVLNGCVVAAVHVIPSGLVIILIVLPVSNPPATQRYPFHATQCPTELSKGLVLIVQVIPSILVEIAFVFPPAGTPIATHKDPFQAIPFPAPAAPNGFGVIDCQFIPSGLVKIEDELIALVPTPTHQVPFQATPLKPPPPPSGAFGATVQFIAS